jgi:hypothetical protein
VLASGSTIVERQIDRDPPMGMMGVIAKLAIKADAMKSLKRSKATAEAKK